MYADGPIGRAVAFAQGDEDALFCREGAEMVEAQTVQVWASMVPPGRIELPTSALPRMRSTTELRRRVTEEAAV